MQNFLPLPFYGISSYVDDLNCLVSPTLIFLSEERGLGECVVPPADVWLFVTYIKVFIK